MARRCRPGSGAKRVNLPFQVAVRSCCAWQRTKICGGMVSALISHHFRPAFSVGLMLLCLNPQSNRPRQDNQTKFFRQENYGVLLHLVDVPNQIHRNAKISVDCKLKKEFAYVMLCRNEWGVSEKPTIVARRPGLCFPGGLFSCVMCSLLLA